MKNFIFILIGFILGTVVSVSYAKYESGTNDAPSVVGYGKTSGGVLVGIKVSSTGVIQ